MFKDYIKRISKILSKVYIALAWAFLIIFLLCLPGAMLPDESKFSIPNFDKLVHFSLFGMLVFLWCYYFYSKKLPLKKAMAFYFIIFCASDALGIGLEFVQRCCIPNRDFELGDIIADMMGASVGYGICNIWLSK